MLESGSYWLVRATVRNIASGFTLPWQLEISHDRSTYIIEIGKCNKLVGPLFHLVLSIYLHTTVGMAR